MNDVLLTRDEVADRGLLNVPPYSYASEIMIALHRDTLDSVHIPHSDVYFVRAALEKRMGYWLPLDVVEEAMKANGWRDRRGSMRY